MTRVVNRLAQIVPNRGSAPDPEAGEPGRAEVAPTEISGWGNYPRVEARERRSEDLEHITRGAVLTRGLGRSYGDSSLPPPGGQVVAGSPLADRILAFDAERGVLRAEAGCALMNLNRLFFSRGWFTPVTPGTHYVTLGGMVAADVHGKNHHVAGTFGEHVRSLRMRVADGRVPQPTKVAVVSRIEPPGGTDALPEASRFLDEGGGQVVVHGWKTVLPLSAVEAVRALAPYCGEFLYTHVDAEGLMAGTDLGAILAVRRATARRVTAAGGITTRAEIDALDAAGVDAVVGMALYTGKLDDPPPAR